ncbi:HK97 family phage prohead protease [Rickettsia massiliae]|uniref:HK97 family phage prohead protease n=1 Tax=Rickettsia massiliae TaxID=35791 RepID=UPI0003064679|nr:HK97 family phage prohead protease [Rickettsia massiliae]
MKIKSITDKEVVIIGYASVYNLIDHHNDTLVNGAFANASHHNVKFLWQHDSKKSIGIITHLAANDHGLKMEAVINNKVKAGMVAIELIKQGAIDGLSIGFYIKNSVYNDARQRVITEAELLEISIVTSFPANQSAKILYITKSQDVEYQDKINELEEKLYNMQNILEIPNNIENQEQKNSFINYVRKGEDNGLMQKLSLNSSAEAGGVLILQTLYNSIITEINASRSPMRQLASIETISTNALDIISEDGKFSSWLDWGSRSSRRDSGSEVKSAAYFCS